MEEHIVKVIKTGELTHNVRRIRVEKPKGYTFKPGQATEVAVNDGKWKKEARPFTFTSLSDEPYLEFNIKIYSDHDGTTNRIGSIKEGDELIIHDVWGAINYKGPGVFIAGGAGVTPFIAILRQLEVDGETKGNTLIFSNDKEEDIIRKSDFERILGNDFINTLTGEDLPQYDNKKIDKAYLQEKISDFNQNFYICGPDPMVKAIQKILEELGAKEIILEE